MDVTVISIVGGPDVQLVPHWLAHYRSLGLDQFVVVVNDPLRAAEYGRYLIANGVRPAYYMEEQLFHVDEWNARNRLNDATTSNWLLQADLDELVVFDRPLERLLEECEVGGYRFVPGRFIDHIQGEGDLVAIQDVPSLWQQFPLMHPMTEYVRQGCTSKVVLRQRDFPITVGNHLSYGTEAELERRYPGWQEVHHFRWTSGLVPGLRHRIEVWPECHFRDEWENVLRFLGDSSRLDLDRLRELAPFIDPKMTFLRFFGEKTDRLGV